MLHICAMAIFARLRMFISNCRGKMSTEKSAEVIFVVPAKSGFRQVRGQTTRTGEVGAIPAFKELRDVTHYKKAPPLE
jgi:lysophospholipid acyltransferase (LPLAT)-like uncharacterized protein